MELGSWGQKLVEAMTGVLDGDRRLIDPSNENSSKFVVQDEIEKAFESLNPKLQGEEKWKKLFTKMSPYFEAGFLLVSDQNQWTTADTFIFGKRFAPPKSQPVYFGHSLPHTKVGQVARARGRAVLESYHLQGLGQLRESSAFLMRVTPQVAFLLICNRPGPWQQTFMERFFDSYTKLQSR